jgi:hypothetical protein
MIGPQSSDFTTRRTPPEDGSYASAVRCPFQPCVSPDLRDLAYWFLETYFAHSSAGRESNLGYPVLPYHLPVPTHRPFKQTAHSDLLHIALVDERRLAGSQSRIRDQNYFCLPDRPLVGSRLRNKRALTY